MGAWVWEGVGMCAAGGANGRRSWGDGGTSSNEARLTEHLLRFAY